MNANTVIRTQKYTFNCRMFEYGGGHRVVYIKTDNDSHETHLLAHHDEFYEDPAQAEKAYNKIKAIIEGNVPAPSPRLVKRAFEYGLNIAGCDIVLKAHPDKIITHGKSNTMEFRRDFFYQHGGTADKWAALIEGDLKALGLKFKMTESHEIWRAWPKDSYWTCSAEIQFTK